VPDTADTGAVHFRCLLIKTNPCMVFSQSTCPFCVKAKNLLITELGATVKVVELNLDKELGYPIRYCYYDVTYYCYSVII
jgi:hypothetical protein